MSVRGGMPRLKTLVRGFQPRPGDAVFTRVPQFCARTDIPLYETLIYFFAEMSMSYFLANVALS